MITAMFTCTLLVATRKSRGLSSWLPRNVTSNLVTRPPGPARRSLTHRHSGGRFKEWILPNGFHSIKWLILLWIVHIVCVDGSHRHNVVHWQYFLCYSINASVSTRTQNVSLSCAAVLGIFLYFWKIIQLNIMPVEALAASAIEPSAGAIVMKRQKMTFVWLNCIKYGINHICEIRESYFRVCKSYIPVQKS